MPHNKIRIIWADDEIELLKPHIRFLEGKGYHVDSVANGEDAIVLFQQSRYDLVLLDEMMPGKDGLATLAEMKELDASVPIVLITKSEEESLMEDAIGRKIDDYLVKPVHPSQVLLTVKRLTEARRLQEGRFTRDYVEEFNRLQGLRHEAMNKDDWVDMYQKVSRLEVDLFQIEDFGLRRAHADLKRELNRDFSRFLEADYPRWVANPSERPPMSTDILSQFVLPHLRRDEQVFLIVLDCMRFDQWLVLQSQVDPYFRPEVHLFYSVLPTATPYSRNAMFSGLLPKEIHEQHPEWWVEVGAEDRSKNRHERDLLAELLKREGLEGKNFKYQRVFHPDEEAAVRRQINTYNDIPLVALVFNFLDLLTHGRSESRVLRELAPDEAGFRSLLASWFSHSALFDILKEISQMGVTVVLTTDHGAIQARRSTLVHGDRQTSTNLRYKYGTNLRSEEKETVLIKDPEKWGLPNDLLNKNYILAREDYYCVYPTNFHEYERLYRNSFQHGGVAMEEVILPCVVLRPR